MEFYQASRSRDIPMEKYTEAWGSSEIGFQHIAVGMRLNLLQAVSLRETGQQFALMLGSLDIAEIVEAW